MTAAKRTVWIVTGNTYHTQPSCSHLRGKTAQTLKRDYAESQGFHLCSRCSADERCSKRRGVNA